MRLHFNKDTGPKPAKIHLLEASKLAKPGSKDHIVVAMAFRPNGVTQQEVIKLLDYPHRNKLKKLLADGKVKAAVLPDGGRSTRLRLVKK